MGSLMVWLFLKSNNSHCNLFSRKGREIFRITLFQSKEDTFFDKEMALQKGCFGSLAERARIQAPINP